MRRALLVFSLALPATLAGLSVHVYRVRVAPEGAPSGRGPIARLFGPSASALSSMAEQHLDLGLAALEDAAVSPAARIETYRAHLGAAEKILLRSLRAQPAQARALSRLAAARWELDPPLTEEAARRHLETIELASRMAPGSPLVHRQLGLLLLRMGRREEAVRYLGRAVRLDPASAHLVVQILEAHLFSPAEMLGSLPPHPDAVAALAGAFSRGGLERDYVEAVEPLLGRATPALLTAYGNATLRAGLTERMLTRTAAVAGTGPETRVELCLQRSRAEAELGRLDAALREVREALTIDPDNPRLEEQLGDVLLLAARPDEAAGAYGQALARVVRGSASPAWRARLYRKIGEAREAQGRIEQAWDAYKRALSLDPEERVARRRLGRMGGAAAARP